MSTLIGRDTETNQLAGLIGRAATAGHAVVLIGEPGIGKTALLGAAEELARAAGFEVLTAAGVEPETLARRQAALAALASVLDGDPYRRTWHRAQSIVGPDEVAGPCPVTRDSAHMKIWPELRTLTGHAASS